MFWPESVPYAIFRGPVDVYLHYPKIVLLHIMPAYRKLRMTTVFSSRFISQFDARMVFAVELMTIEFQILVRGQLWSR